jgi:hypothetical protein
VCKCRYTGGRLTIEDVPPGSLNPWLRAEQVRREIKRILWEKEKRLRAEEEAKRRAKLKKKKDNSAIVEPPDPAWQDPAQDAGNNLLRNPADKCTQSNVLRKLAETSLSSLLA